MSETKLSTSLHLGKICYLNTLPFYHGLGEQDPNLVIDEGHPTQINRLIQEGQIDLAPISSLEYGVHPQNYYLLPDLCIGSNYFSGSVLLFSRVKISELNGKTIALSEESLSSQGLLKILLSKCYQFQNSFVALPSNPKQMLENALACLAIGDSALFHQTDEFVYKYDLGELWCEWTQKPFCFSVWAVRKSFFDQNREEVYAFHEKLKQTTQQNLQDLRTLIETSLGLSSYDQKFAQIFSYLSQLTYDFNETMQEGLIYFFNLARELQLIPTTPPLEFLPERL